MATHDLDLHLLKAVEYLRTEYGKLQIGRATTSLIEGIEVDAYGGKMDLRSVANLAAMDAKTLKVEPWDKTLINGIESAIREAGLGLNPQNMGDHLYISIPAMTEERRKEIVRKVREFAEESRIVVRHAREEARKQVKHEKEENLLSEDDVVRENEQIQKKVDKSNQEIEEAMKKKESEVMSI